GHRDHGLLPRALALPRSLRGGSLLAGARPGLAALGAGGVVPCTQHRALVHAQPARETACVLGTHRAIADPGHTPCSTPLTPTLRPPPLAAGLVSPRRGGAGPRGPRRGRRRALHAARCARPCPASPRDGVRTRDASRDRGSGPTPVPPSAAH